MRRFQFALFMRKFDVFHPLCLCHVLVENAFVSEQVVHRGEKTEAKIRAGFRGGAIGVNAPDGMANYAFAPSALRKNLTPVLAKMS